jgi:hypothetical protein
MATTPAPLSSTYSKAAVIGAIADTVLKPLSGADDAGQSAQTIAETAAVGAQIAEVAAPQYKAQIELAASLEPVAYHAGLALAHLFQHWLHHTTNQPAK